LRIVTVHELGACIRSPLASDAPARFVVDLVIRQEGVVACMSVLVEHAADSPWRSMEHMVRVILSDRGQSEAALLYGPPQGSSRSAQGFPGTPQEADDHRHQRGSRSRGSSARKSPRLPARQSIREVSTPRGGNLASSRCQTPSREAFLGGGGGGGGEGSRMSSTGTPRRARRFPDERIKPMSCNGCFREQQGGTGFVASRPHTPREAYRGGGDSDTGVGFKHTPRSVSPPRDGSTKNMHLHGHFRDSLNEGGTFVSSRPQTPSREAYLGASDVQGTPRFRGHRGGAFVAAHVQRPQLPGQLQSDEKSIELMRDLLYTFRSFRSGDQSSRSSQPSSSPRRQPTRDEGTRHPDVYGPVRSSLNEGSNFVSSRSQTPSREAYLGGGDIPGTVDFKDILRPDIHRGGTFVGSSGQRAELQGYLSASDTEEKPLFDTLRESMRQGPTVWSSSRSTKPDYAFLQASEDAVHDWKDVLRPELRRGGTFVSARHGREKSSDFLSESGEGPLHFEDTLRQNLRQGGTFVSSRSDVIPFDHSRPFFRSPMSARDSPRREWNSVYDFGHRSLRDDMPLPGF